MKRFGVWFNFRKQDFREKLQGEEMKLSMGWDIWNTWMLRG